MPCETGIDCAQALDISALIEGKISKEAYWDRIVARAAGGLIGTAASIPVLYLLELAAFQAAASAGPAAAGALCAPSAEATAAQVAQLTELIKAGRGASAIMIIRQVAGTPGGLQTLRSIQDLVVRMIPHSLNDRAASTLINLSHRLTQQTGLAGFQIIGRYVKGE